MIPRVSVVIPTYNQEQYISAALESVLNQTYQDFEIVIVNDASSDHTLDQILQFNDSRIRLFNLPTNQGESSATNHGINQARGELIAILHSDDVYVPEKLEKQVNFLDHHSEFDAVLSYPEMIDSKGNPLPPKKSVLQTVFIQPNRTRFQWLNYFFSKDNCLCQPSSLVRKRCYDQVGLYDQRFRQLPDFDFWVRFCLKFNLYILPEKLIKYRFHQSNLSRMKPEIVIRHTFEVSQVLKHYLCPEVYNHLTEIFPNCLKTGEILYPNLAPFLLARQALTLSRPTHQYFGLDVIFKLLENPETADQLKQHYSFQASDLHQLTGKLDIFKIISPQKQHTQLNSPQAQPTTVKSSNILSDNQPPLVSLIIPTYNGSAFLAEALESASSQTYPNLELIISDDASTDNTLKIAQSFQRDSSLPVAIISHPNYGLVKNLNFCIDHAKGKYIKFLFQDDLLEQNCITEMVKLAEKDPEIGLVFSPRRVFIAQSSESNLLCQAAQKGAKGLEQKWSGLKSIQLGQELLSDPNCLEGTINKIGEPTTVLIPQTVFQKIGKFDPNLHQLLDGDMWFRIMGHYKVGFVNQVLSSLRIHSGQQTQKNISRGQNLKDYHTLYHKMIFDPGYDFLSQDLKIKVFKKWLNKSPEVLTLTRSLIEHYYQNSLDTVTLDYLCLLRQILAKQGLKLPIEQLKENYLGDWGKTQKALIDSGIRQEKLTKSEQIFVNQITQELTPGLKQNNALKFVLAAMLYCPAHQLPAFYKNAAIPQYFLPDFLKFLWTPVDFFHSPEEVRQWLQFMPDLLDYIDDNLSSNNFGNLGSYITKIYTQVANSAPLKLIPDSVSLLNILKKRASLIEYYIKINSDNLDEFFPKNKSNSHKIFLGIFLEELGYNWQTFALIPIIKKIDCTQFQIILYNFRIENDILPELCLTDTQAVKQLPQTLTEALQQIRQDDLDLMIFGSDLTERATLMCQLALHRLARVQIRLGDVPITTGMRHMDYLLVGDLTGSQTTSQKHYQEQLVTLKGSGLCWSYPTQFPAASVQPTRKSWGATAESVILMVSGKIEGISPQMRQTWVKILTHLPQGIVVFSPFASDISSHSVHFFLKHMRSQLAQAQLDPRQFVMLKPLTHVADFKKCLSQADLYLDLFPTNATGAVIEALLAGVPTVVQEGKMPRSRQSAAVLKELSIPELIAPNEQSYIELAVALGTHSTQRQHYRQQIQQNIQNHPPFLDSQAYATQVGAVLQQMVQKRLTQ